MKKILQFGLAAAVALAALPSPALQHGGRGGAAFARAQAHPQGGQQQHEPNANTRRDQNLRDQTAGPAARGFGRGPGPNARVGRWLREHQNLSASEQEQALQNEPQFQKLPPERQQKMMEQLRNFNNLPQAQRQRWLDRMQAIEELSPTQRENLEKSMAQFRDLPPERKRAVRRAYMNMRAMTPEQRDRVANSDQYKNFFNDQERGIISGILDSGIDLENRPEAGANGQQAPQQAPK